MEFIHDRSFGQRCSIWYSKAGHLSVVCKLINESLQKCFMSFFLLKTAKLATSLAFGLNIAKTDHEILLKSLH